ncbi:hypothetical protein [Nocardioides sp.]|uniref:hypothetical protein n=1 Tax=Nocardioides sp. TaxID=35761 RepID=UPI00356920FF
MSRIVLVPGVLALLPEYAGLADPVDELRAAAAAAVGWLVESPGPVRVVADEQGARVARHLLVEAGHDQAFGAGDERVLVVANGSARRGEKAPGHLDPRAVGFDAALEDALRSSDGAVLQGLDVALAEELLVGHPSGIRDLGARLRAAGPAVVDYDDDPFGVQYWVMRWTCGS